MANEGKKKDAFELLEDEFKDSVQQMSPEDIKKRVAEIALAHSELMKAKKEDQDLLEKKEAYSLASTQYRESSKFSKLRIDYCKSILDNKGVK